MSGIPKFFGTSYFEAALAGLSQSLGLYKKKPFGTWQFDKSCVLISFINQDLKFFKNCSTFLSVSFMGANVRELRENKKHIIRALKTHEEEPYAGDLFLAFRCPASQPSEGLCLKLPYE